MSENQKKGIAFGISGILFLLVASSTFLLVYLFFFQSGQIISRNRLLIAAAVGLVFGAAAFIFALRSRRTSKK
jgi:hypothetical protein